MQKSLESGARLLLVCALVACGSEADDLFVAAGASGNGGASAGNGGDAGFGGNSGDGGSGAEAGSSAGGSSAAGGSSGAGGEDAGSGGSSGDPGDATTTDAGTEEGSSGAAGASDAGADAGGAAGVGNCADPVTYYADADKDGHGDPKVSVKSCAQPAGYVTSSDDCYDANKQANPNQSGWFLIDRGDGSYDYDCDGNGAPRFPEVGRCQSLAICMTTEGWQEAVAPCGQEKAWITGCTFPLCTPPITEKRKQECH